VPGVKVLGFVDDIAAVYDASWFTVCPLWMGAGTNIKIIESLVFGRTCVTTDVGRRGYEDYLRSGDSLVAVASADSVADECIRLIKNDAQRAALGERGRKVVQREFSYERFAGVVHREVERALRRQSFAGARH
jgi:glycosyltransferase involved in cell wall biosynthesis